MSKLDWFYYRLREKFLLLVLTNSKLKSFFHAECLGWGDWKFHYFILGKKFTYYWYTVNL